MPALPLCAFGSGPALVLLAGSPTSPATMRKLAVLLSAKYRVVIPTLPGHWGTDPLPAGSSVAGVHDLIEATLHAEGIDEAAVVGFSAGAYHALALATRARLSVPAVVSLAGKADFSGEREHIHSFVHMLRQGPPPPPQMFVARMLSDAFAAAHPEAVDEVIDWFAGMSPTAFATELEAFADAPDLRPALPRYEGRVLARVGALDAATPPTHSRAIVASSREGALQIVDGCGHALVVEDLAATVGAIEDFVDR